jgi:hypothetical protein
MLYQAIESELISSAMAVKASTLSDLTGLWHARGYGEYKLTRSNGNHRQKGVKGCYLKLVALKRNNRRQIEMPQ